MDTQKMQQIVEKLNKWAYEYYVLDNPTVDDATYDALYDKLVEMEGESGIILPNSPTRRVGGQPLQKFESYTHKQRLYSLDKAQTKAQLDDWIEKIRLQYGNIFFTVELKYDGLSISVTYDGGQLVCAATRGNGTVGEQVTAQAQCIKSLPLQIDFKEQIEIQGETIMRLSVLDEYNRKHPDNQLKNARNGAAGAIRNLDPKVSAERNLDCVMYAVGLGTEYFRSQTELVGYLRKNYFKTNSLFVRTDKKEEIFQTIDFVEQQREKYDFLIDGVVIKVDDFSIRNQLGHTDKFPRWAIAYKFEAEQAATTLCDVIWQVGRTGKLTPLAILSPVELCGATISRATLNNFDDIVRKQLSIGDTVLIRRSNDVIPEVLYSLEENSSGEKISPPQKCPVCNADTQFRGAHLFCPNTRGCKAQIVGRLTHYASKNACDIEGLSEKTVERLVDRLGTSGFSDMYCLTKEQLSSLEGFKDKKTQNLLVAIEDSKKVKLPNLIFALGIGNVGIVSARDLAERYKSLDALAVAQMEDLVQIDEVGDIVARSIIDYFSDAFNLSQIEKLKQLGINPVFEQTAQKEGVFAGRQVVLTGTLQSMTREQAAKYIQDLGGATLASVTKSCNLVVAGQSAGSKLVKAQSMGIEVIDEQQFLTLIKKGGILTD